MLAYSKDFVVGSWGGVGSTTLLRGLFKVKKTNSPDDLDGIKHGFFPPLPFRCNDGFRGLFVIGDPLEAVLSLFRRRLQFGQWQKVVSMVGKKTGVYVRRQEPLRSVLERGHDPFFLERQLENWTNRRLVGYPIKIVKYNELFLEEDSIRAFLGVEENFDELGIVRKERISSLDLAGKRERELLERTYGGLRAKVNAFERDTIIQPVGPFGCFHLIGKTAFWRMAVRRFGDMYLAR